MKKRRHLSRRESKRNFRRHAHTHKRNVSPVPMRGGIRL